MLEIDKASTCSVELFEHKNLQSTVKLLMHSNSRSNSCACTSTDLLHNWTENKGLVNGTVGGKSEVIACGKLHALFTMHNAKHRIVI